MARVIVIGSGLGGFSASVELSRRGHEVILLDAKKSLGGRSTSIIESDWVLDQGPHLLRGRGLHIKWLKRLSKYNIPVRRLPPASIAFIHKGLQRPLPVGLSAIKQDLFLDTPTRGEIIKLKRRLNRDLKQYPEKSFFEWYEALPESIKPIISTLNFISSWIPLENSGTVKFHINLILETLSKRGLLQPLVGWTEISGRWLTALDQLEVTTFSKAKITKISLNKKGTVNGVMLAAGDNLECDAIIITCPPKQAYKMLKNSGIDWKPPSLKPLNATLWDLGLSFRPLKNLAGLWDSELATYAYCPTAVAPERLPKEGHEEGWCQLQILAVHDSKQSEQVNHAEQRIEQFLQKHCLGWQSHVKLERKTEKITIASTLAISCNSNKIQNHRPECDELAQHNIWLAGDWVNSSQWLSEGAIECGFAAGNHLHDSLK